MTIYFGIDYGAVNTGFIARDGKTILEAHTFVKPEPLTIEEWAREIIGVINKETLLEEISDKIIGIEGIADPKGFNRGQKAPINPKYIMRGAVVLGALLHAYPQAIVVPPGKNGSRATHTYPKELIGPRPKELRGSGNGTTGGRGHEKSAYDISVTAEYLRYQQSPKNRSLFS